MSGTAIAKRGAVRHGMLKKGLTGKYVRPCDTHAIDSLSTADLRMTGHAVFGLRLRRRTRGLLLPLVLLFASLSALVSFVSYVLWPTWPKAATALDAPSLPVMVAGVLFNVPTAAIRAPVERQPGAHERIDLVFLWPSLEPPPPEGFASAEKLTPGDSDAPPLSSNGRDRLFVTITGLGNVLAPIERLRTIYPRYFQSQATAADDGLAVLPFRSGTPYEGEDLIYLADKPDRFFARCTRETVHALPATCIHERLVDAAEMTLRFPRAWLQDWRGVVAGFDRLVMQLHQQAEQSERKTDEQ